MAAHPDDGWEVVDRPAGNPAGPDTPPPGPQENRTVPPGNDWEVVDRSADPPGPHESAAPPSEDGGGTHPADRPPPAPSPDDRRDRCWSCGCTADGTGTGTGPPAAECPQCFSPRLLLTLDFAGLGTVLRTDPAAPLRLGRDPEWALAGTAAALAAVLTVSRRHATVGLEPDGTAWVAEDGGSATRNGTWVNGVRVPCGGRHPLRDGDRLGLGTRVVATVRVTPGTSPPASPA
ncbi:FHA domain-containing protein [Streptomyces aidingensis]|uniref:FHA domain-containing protein n=1 Tax=Streptomyces aidingensis TaxID=910347 RepID=A0A1I1QUL1_9ACTN|nr:FHA domain-containing protein [Streptomyces aidingensis]SFD25786.1 FHA domain-containing protein [Streptomyces aidingensis]